MKHLQLFQKKKAKAQQKQKKGMLLNNSESIAIKDQWFFTIVLPIEVIDQIVSISEKYGVKPSDIGTLYISQGLQKEKGKS